MMGREKNEFESLFSILWSILRHNEVVMNGSCRVNIECREHAVVQRLQRWTCILVVFCFFSVAKRTSSVSLRLELLFDVLSLC